MKFTLSLLMGLVACACFVQTQANILDTVKEKVMGHKDEEAKKGEEEKKDKDVYGGGLAKQVAHTVLDAAVDRLVHEAKERTDSKIGDMAIGMATSAIKTKLHETVSNLGEDKKKEEEEKKKAEGGEQHQGEQEHHEEGEKKEEEEKSGLGKLIEKVTRRKRSVLSGKSNDAAKQPGRISRALHKVKSMFKPNPSTGSPAPAPAPAPAAPVSNGKPSPAAPATSTTSAPVSTSAPVTTEAGPAEAEPEKAEPEKVEPEKAEAEEKSEEKEEKEDEAEEKADEKEEKEEAEKKGEEKKE